MEHVSDDAPTSFDPALEREKIVGFIRSVVGSRQKLTIGLSGGVDSDVCTRLVVEAVGRERVVPFHVLQDHQDPEHVTLAQKLAVELGLDLCEVDLSGSDLELLEKCARGGAFGGSTNDALLRGKAKNLLRSFVAGLLVEGGSYLVGTANQTEVETGFFLPLGDGLGHLLPIAHLYKSEVYALAPLVGTGVNVLQKPASAGYWVGESDLHDLAYWIVLGRPPSSSEEALKFAGEHLEDVRSWLDFRRIDRALQALKSEETDEQIARTVDWPLEVVRGLRSVVEHTASRRTPLHSRLTVGAP